MSLINAFRVAVPLLLLVPLPAVGMARTGDGAEVQRAQRHHALHARHPVRQTGRTSTGAAPPDDGARLPAGAPERSEFGGVDQFGYPDTDPERPYGVNNTVTAPLGSVAAQEQENNRRSFCMAVPEHC